MSKMLGTMALWAAGAVLLAGRPAFAARCGGNSHNPLRCGLDTEANPGSRMGACTEAWLQESIATELYRNTGMCRPGSTMVIYDLQQPFPDNGLAADQVHVGRKSFVTIRAGGNSACANMVDTVEPTPCTEPNPQVCPNPPTPPPGTISVPITGWMVGCWTPIDHKGCREVKFSTMSACIHAGHEFLGPGCTQAGDVDCPNVSVEQVAVNPSGTKNAHTCGPVDETVSCRATRSKPLPGRELFHLWFGAFCTTNNCEDPGVDPQVGEGTCQVQWGATKPGFNIPPFEGVNEPGWYDWKTGSFRVADSSGKPECGALDACIGERTGEDWDLILVAVPRPGQPIPCIGSAACDPPGCF